MSAPAAPLIAAGESAFDTRGLDATAMLTLPGCPVVTSEAVRGVVFGALFKESRKVLDSLALNETIGEPL